MLSLTSKIILAILVLSIIISSAIITIHILREITTSYQPVKEETVTKPTITPTLTEQPISRGERVGEETLHIRRFRSYNELDRYIRSLIQEYMLYLENVLSTMYNVLKPLLPVFSSEEYTWPIMYPPILPPYTQNVTLREEDIVKSDGEHIYLAVLNKVFIVKAYPPEEAKVISKLNLRKPIIGLYVKRNKLIVISEYTLRKHITHNTYSLKLMEAYNYSTIVTVYDVSNITKPVIVENITLTGVYLTSRMIDNYVYVVTILPVMKSIREKPVIPLLNDNPIPPHKILCLLEHIDYVYLIILILNVETCEYSTKVFLTGMPSNIYISHRNLYILSHKWIRPTNITAQLVRAITTILPLSVRESIKHLIDNKSLSIYEKYKLLMRSIDEWLSGQPESVRNRVLNKLVKLHCSLICKVETLIYRFKLRGLKITLEAVGTVSGMVLDEYSMSEYGEFFRVVTLKPEPLLPVNIVKPVNTSSVYVLDMNLDVIGKLENITLRSKIYSVRFIGNTLYIITFNKVKPLYVVDLSNPNRPKVIGYLNIPGYFRYLHPYRNRYLIGLGHSISDEGKVIGLKISLFDISNITNVRELSTLVVEGRKLISVSHKLILVREDKGYFAFIGDRVHVYIVGINGTTLKLRGVIEHPFVKRILCIRGYIYTIATSPKLVKILTEDTLQLVKEVNISPLKGKK